MISSIYVILGALLLIKLAINVTTLRSQYRIPYGDGGFYELQIAIQVYGNAVEYIPIAIILLIMMEMNGSQIWMIHIDGIMLITGHLLYIYGMHHQEITWRRSGTSAIFVALSLMVLANTYYFPWSHIFKLT